MRKTIGAFALIAAAIAICSPGLATVLPNALFCDDALLQRGIAVPVWGTAADGEKVTVTFEGQSVSTTAKDGKWMVRLKPLEAGGPFGMTIEGSNKIELKNVLVGEVWICSGQSNMALTLKGVDNAEDVIAHSGDKMLRLFTVPRAGVSAPADDLRGAWSEASPDTTPTFSAAGYFFGRDLRKSLNVPVGLINTSFGGTRIESWTSADGLKPLWDQLQKEFSAQPNRNQQKDPSALYNGMIHPLIPYAIRGAIWYQGEANSRPNAYAYRTLLADMIRDWRRAWGQGEFPFLFVQLPGYELPWDKGGSAWAVLRESQLVVSQTVPKTAMAVTIDHGDPTNIHPKQKEPVGARLALAARAIAYGEKLIYRGPTYKSVSFKDSQATIEFDSIGDGLVAKDGDLKGFTLAGEDRQFHDANAKIDGKRVIVSSLEVAKPVAVRYGWANCPTVNLFNANGLPASPFRTDDFPVTKAQPAQ